MSEMRFYPGWSLRANELAEHIMRSYGGDGFQTQMLEIPGDGPRSGGIVLQVRETYTEGWQKTLSNMTGMDTAATLTLKREGDALSVEVGGGKWLDKAAVAGVAMLTAGLLLLPAGIGAFKQNKLLEDLMADCDRYVRTATSGGATTIDVDVEA